MRRQRAVLVLATLGAIAPALGQTDEQTREILERERRAYEQKMKQAPQTAPSAEAPAADPEAERRKALEQFVADADRLIRDRNFAVKSTPHYKVQTDDPRLDPAAAADLVESFRAFFDRFWEGRTALRPYDDVGRIYLFYSYFKYNQLLTGHPRFDTVQSIGHYRPLFDVVVIHTDPVDPAELADALVHEAAHQLIANRLYEPGAPQSLWLAEGLAAYFGYTARDASGAFVPGGIGGKGVTLLRGQTRAAEGNARRQLSEFRKEVKRTPSLGLAELVAMTDPQVFYGQGADGRYARAWLLVHYLLHGDEGKLAAPFLRYLEEETAGRGGSEVFFRILGRTPEAVDAGLREYVMSLQESPARRPDGSAPGA